MSKMGPVSRFFICLNIFLAVSFQADSGLLRGEIQVMSANLVSGGWPNINYYSNSRRIFQGLTPDIVLIQEFKVATGSTREEYVNEVFGPGYYLYYEIGSSPNGIISRWPFKSAGEWSDPEVSDRDFAWAVINIPGDIDLQVVSVHLKASPGPTERETRRVESEQIKAYVQANFDDDHYILVGGDLNTYHSPVEPCLSVFASFLDYNDHTPADRLGNSDTNEGRDKRYDWLMANHLLDELHTTTMVGTQDRSYSEGIVFDSWVFPNVASEVPPIKYDDSHGTMDHMGMIKTYNIDTPPPIMEEGFDDYQIGTRPAGWTFTNCSQNSDTYTATGNYGAASPSIRLDAGGDVIKTAPFTNPDALQFWLKGQGTDSSSHLLVEEYYAATWYEVSDIFNFPTTGTQFGEFSLNPSTNQLKFTYTKGSVNLAIDDVYLEEGEPTVTPLSSATPTPGPIPQKTATPGTTPQTSTPTPGPIPQKTATHRKTITPNPNPTPGMTPQISTPTPGPIPQKTATPRKTITPNPTTGTTPQTPTPTPVPVTTPSTTPTQTPLMPPQPSPTNAPGGPLWIYDYDGDGTSDVGIYHGSSGLWAIRAVTRIYFGGSMDDPVPGDYDGDGTTDIGIFRSAAGLWAMRGVSRVYFGSSSDLPQPGDYDGDGSCDVGIFRGASGLWAIRGVTRIYFGGVTDEPVPGYFNGAGAKNIGIFRPTYGLWAIRSVTRVYFGGSLDDTVPGDYNGSGSWDIGIFRSTAGLWAVRGVSRTYFGSAFDLPVPGDYAGTGTDAVGIFRGTSGLWAVRGITRAYYGSSGDVPVTR